MKYRVRASIPTGNGNVETMEEIADLEWNENDFEAINTVLDEVLWNLLQNLGVETSIEKVEE